MKTFISPIGYNSTSVTRSVLGHGLTAGDTVILIRPLEETDESRSDEALNDVRQVLPDVVPGVTIELRRIPHTDLEAALDSYQQLLQNADGSVVVNLGGGARDLLYPFMAVVFKEHEMVDTVLQFSDIDGQVREFALPRIDLGVSESVLETLEAVADLEDETTIPSITDHTGRPKSTITRHISRLDACGAVESWKEGKVKYVSLTTTGKLEVRSFTGG